MTTPMILLHVPHSSKVIPDDVRGDLLITDEELERELLRLTDAFTDEIFDIRDSHIEVVVYPFSRMVADPERLTEDAREMMAPMGMGAVYTRTTEGTPLRGDISHRQREQILDTCYRPHHNRLTTLTERALARHGRCLIIDCHSFPSCPLPSDLDRKPNRPDICIGTDAFHTPEDLAAFAVDLFSKEGFDTRRNTPYVGTMVPVTSCGRDRRVSSVMIEINRKLYMNEESGRKRRGFAAFTRRMDGIIRCLISEYLHGSGEE
jgi:N-formylglutamate deformylase